jgi:hypothetical protein
MGIQPGELKRMTVWESIVVMEHWIEAHGGAKGMSEGEKVEMWEWLQQQPPMPLSHHKRPNGGA